MYCTSSFSRALQMRNKSAHARSMVRTPRGPTDGRNDGKGRVEGANQTKEIYTRFPSTLA